MARCLRQRRESHEMFEERFSALSAAEQDRLKSEARAERAMARRAPSRLDDSLREEDDDAAQGPLGLGSPDRLTFPVAAVCA